VFFPQVQLLVRVQPGTELLVMLEAVRVDQVAQLHEVRALHHQSLVHPCPMELVEQATA
jgi:hypothetical protein